MNLTADFVTNAFFTIAFIDILVKFLKWIKLKKNSSKSFLALQIKYFISNFAIQIPLIIQSPFVHRRYVDGGLTNAEIAQVKIVYNVFAAIFSIFIGKFLSIFEHRKLICFSNMISSLASFLRGIGTKTNFLIAAVLIGFASSMVRVSFDDWLISERSKITDCPDSHFIFTENYSLLNIVISVVFLSISDCLHKKSGTDMIFYVTSVLQFIGSIIVLFYLKKAPTNKQSEENETSKLNSSEENEKSKQKSSEKNKNSNAVSSYKEAFQTVVKSKDKVLLLMILMDQCYGILVSLFWPAVPSYFPEKTIPMAKITGMGQLSTLLGAMLIPILCKYFSSSIILPILFAGSAFCDVIMSNAFDNKFVLYWLIFALCINDGCITSLMLGFRMNILPSNIRAHILGINRLFQSFYSSILIALAERFPCNKQPLFSAGVLFVCSLLAFIIKVLRDKKADSKKNS